MGILKTFDGYVSDKSISSEELPDYAIKLIESKKGGALKWLKSIFFPDRAKNSGAQGSWGTTETDIEPEIPFVSGGQPYLEAQEKVPPRKSLDEIFGVKK